MPHLSTLRLARAHSPPPDEDNPVDPQQDIHARLKRRITELERERDANAHAKPATSRTNVTLGRIIRKAVSFNQPIAAIIGEYDRRAEYEDEHGSLDDLSVDDEQRRLHNAFIELEKLIPSLKKTLANVDMDQYNQTLTEFQHGASAAVGDDNNSIRSAIIAFLPLPSTVEEALDPSSRENRGLESSITGPLLCPTVHNWNNQTTRANVINGKAGYEVNAHKWPLCIYRNSEYNPEKKFAGFLKAKSLVQVAMHIFTSPGSASNANESGRYVEDSEAEQENIDPSAVRSREPPRKRRKKMSVQPKGSVADKFRIRHVTPRMIAYAAVQQRFNLSDATNWYELDGAFDYSVYYNNIIDFFESAPSPTSRKKVQELLCWWDRRIFPRSCGSSSTRPSIQAHSAVDDMHAELELDEN
ncbi:hypothetical protein GGX14DRAFT_647825 [Mycena pura]|uniref:Uncharacterized protein n=1 Tax=Mycena pura TaxID=153505 RepID=A0AAD6VD69_9AGAR|nr:hypothetical protein GGX14DRAFT_647825 [Mycena pura]